MFFKLLNFLDHSYSRNVSFAFLMGIFCILLGSVATFLFVTSCFVLIFFNPKASVSKVWKDTKQLCSELPIILCFPLFYIVVLATSFRGDNWLFDSLIIAGSYWQFLFLVPATVGLYYLSKDVNFAGLFTYGCRVALIFVVPLSFFQIYYFESRADGFLNNYLIFASICIAGAGLSILEWPEDTHKNKVLSWITLTSGMLAALLTFSRGMLLPILVVTTLAFLYHYKSKSVLQLSIRKIMILVGLFVGVFIALMQTENGWRFLDQRLLQPVEMMNLGELNDRTISHRLDMQKTGYYAFTEKPLFGHGVQNAVIQANAVSEKVLGRKTAYTYTHLHNDFLTHAVGGGLILLILFATVIFSPVIIALQLQKYETGITLLFYSIMLSGAFSMIALTNIVFHNDQLTTMFCVSTMFIIVRKLQIMNGDKNLRIPDLSIIANGVNPLGLKEPR